MISDASTERKMESRSRFLPPSGARPTNDAAFRLHEGRTLGGTLAWGPSTGAGTMLGHEDDIVLAGTYRVHWNDYSERNAPHGAFRSLALFVELSGSLP